MNRVTHYVNRLISYTTQNIAAYQTRDWMESAEHAVRIYLSDKPELYERHDAAADLVKIIEYAHTPRPRGPLEANRILIFKDLTLSSKFNPVLKQAEKLFLVKDFHAERAGRIILTVAAKHGLGVTNTDWPAITEKIATRAESLLTAGVHLDAYCELLSNLVTVMPGKLNTYDLYTQLSDQLARRMASVTGNEDIGARTRMLRILAEGLEYPQVLNIGSLNGESLESDAKSIAYGRAQTRYHKAVEKLGL